MSHPPPPAPGSPLPSRRSFLSAVGLGAVGAVASGPLAGSAAAAADSLTGAMPLRVAMHVHGSWSEGAASWSAQFAEAQRLGIDVLCLTDHDWRAVAYRFATSLDQARVTPGGQGRAAQRSAVGDPPRARLLVESAGGDPATAALELRQDVRFRDRYHCNVAGLLLRPRFDAVDLPDGTAFELDVGLNHHPKGQRRRAGRLALTYRFRVGGDQRFLGQDPRQGFVELPVPAAGGSVELSPETDAQQLWPDVVALDNSMTRLELRVVSARRGAVAEVGLADVQLARTQTDERSVIRNQQLLADRYGARSGVLGRPLVEVSRLGPHVNVYGVPQFFPDQSQVRPGKLPEFYRALTDAVHDRGGVASVNHPFGAAVGPLLSPSEQVQARRRTYDALAKVDLYGADVLEVGYGLRGQVDTETHLALWDTFSRHLRLLTGNGVADNHEGLAWDASDNGFSTGLWAGSASDRDLSTALAGGRAFAHHLGRWPDGALDLLVDGYAPMGSVSSSRAGRRSVALYVAAAPSGGTVELVQGVVDGQGRDPLTVVQDRIPASAFRASGSATVTREVVTAVPTFVRVQVRDAAGRIVGIGNPAFLLREPPAGGVPVARRPPA